MELLTLLAPLLAHLPSWLSDLIIIAVLASPAASGFTALVPTPETPDATSSRAHRLWWLIYRLIEALALVNARVKQNPDAAKALVSAAERLLDPTALTPSQRAIINSFATHALPPAASVLAGMASEAGSPLPTADRPVDTPLQVQDVAADLLALAGKLR